MATNTQHQSASPFSRLSRLGFGLGMKSQPSSTYSRDTKVDEDDWYIAYNGPYEVPKDLRKRDSWGDVIEEEGVDAVLCDASLIRRYEGVGKEGGNASYRRGRAHSTTSRFTTSSGTNDSSRRNMRSPHRRAAHPKRGPLTSYINLDTVGGVGESPMPPQRSPTSSTTAHRSSITNFFFSSPSVSSRKLIRSPSTTDPLQGSAGSRGLLPNAARTRASLDITRPRHQSLSVVPDSTVSINEDDYYNSYYSTLIATPNKSRSRLLHVSSTVAKSSVTYPESEKKHISPTSPTLSPATLEAQHHPFAYTSPVVRSRAVPSVPQVLSVTFPILQTNHEAKGSVSSGGDCHTRVPAHTLQSVSPPSSNPVIGALKIPPVTPLRSSVSVPDLRIVQAHQGHSPGPTLLPTGVQRWLSAETWCDAMIFPRPRFKVKQGHGVMETVSENHSSRKCRGRLVSPPPTPVAWFAEEPRDTGANGKFVFPKRPWQDGAAGAPTQWPRLPKSRSASNLRLAGTSRDFSPVLSPVALGLKEKATVRAKLQKRRPKHLVLDDLALISVPSLDQ